MKKRIKICTILFIIICLYAFANKKKVENGYFPSTEQTDEEQTIEICSYHSDKGFTTEENGFIIIKK